MFETIYVNFMLLVVLPLILFMIYVGPFILVFSSIIFVLTRKSIDIVSRIQIRRTRKNKENREYVFI